MLLRFTTRERKERELNPQGTYQKMLDRFPTGSRRQSGGPSVVSSMPRPGLEPRTSREKRDMISISPSRPLWAVCHQAEGKGFEPLSPLRESRVSSAVRPTISGYLPYSSVDQPGVEPGLPACRAGVVPLDHKPISSRSVDRRGVEPRSSGCDPDVVPLDQQPLFREVRPGIEPEPRPYQGRVLPQHLQTAFVD